MKALGIAFSARKKGNCLNCIEYVLTKLKEQAFETEVVNTYDCEIKPCSHCDYECFTNKSKDKDEECPIQDDVPEIYRKMKEADIIIVAIPTYGGKASGLYNALTERAQGIIRDYEEFQRDVLSKIFALIVIGNVPAGGDLVYHTVVMDHRDCKYPPTSLLLQAADYGQSSIAGTLITDDRVRKSLDSLVESVLKQQKGRS